MRKTGYLFLILLLMSIILHGCKQKEAESAKSTSPVTIVVGHVGHDHHTALFIALDNTEQFAKESGISVKTVEEFKFYELFDKGQKIADIQIECAQGDKAVE